MINLLFLQFCGAHLLADFALQPARIVANKRKFGPLAAHAGIHVVCACALVNVGFNSRILAAILAVAVVHAAQDYVRASFSRSWGGLLIDQGLHLAVLSSAVVWATNPGWSIVGTSVAEALGSFRAYLFLAAYVAVVFGGSFFVQKVMASFLGTIRLTWPRRSPACRQLARTLAKLSGSWC